MRVPRVTWTSAPLLTLAALAALAACGDDDMDRQPPEAVDFGAWDSAGVRIVESSGEALGTVLPWVVDTVPNLELGEVEGDGPLQFQNISGIVQLPDGGLVVLDEGSRELGWFEASGEPGRTTGGAGRGPGEFLEPLLVPRFQTDSLLIFDRGRRAFTWVAIDGSGERALGPGGPLLTRMPRASAGTRAVFRSASSGSGSCRENEGCEVPVLLRWVDVTGTLADTLAVHPGRMITYTESGPPVLLTGPLDQRGVAAVGPDGPVVEGDPRFELRQFDADGRLLAIFRVDAHAPMAPQDALGLYLQRFSERGEMRRIFELMGLPEVVPAFQALRVDRLGWYWAELFRPGEGGASEWLVFDPNGRARGMVELPSELEVHEIGANFILGRWVDELGVEYVRRYALDRRSV